MQLKVDAEGFNRAVRSQMEDILRQAGSVFLETAYGHVRVDTGMSRGSLVPLARFLKVSTAGWFSGANPRKVNRENRSPDAGMRQSKQGNHITSTGTTATLEWWSEVFQYRLNELYPLRSNQQDPWKSLLKGTYAARAYLMNSNQIMAQLVKQHVYGRRL